MEFVFWNICFNAIYISMHHGKFQWAALNVSYLNLLEFSIELRTFEFGKNSENSSTYFIAFEYILNSIERIDRSESTKSVKQNAISHECECEQNKGQLAVVVLRKSIFFHYVQVHFGFSWIFLSFVSCHTTHFDTHFYLSIVKRTEKKKQKQKKITTTMKTSERTAAKVEIHCEEKKGGEAERTR